MNSILDGIIIGGVGGAIAGITVWLVQFIQEKTIEWVQKRRVYQWLKKNTTKDGDLFRSTRAIASWNNLTEDRVRYICSIDERIFLSTGDKEDMWSLYGREARSVYEKHGIRRA